MNRTALLVMTLVVGCMAGTTATQLMSPAATAAPPGQSAPPQRWQYICDTDLTTEGLNQYGANGWEMVGFGPRSGDYNYCFKRPY